MTQEVEITIRLEVDTSQSKRDITEFINYSFTSTNYKRWLISDYSILSIKEEAELYENN